MPNPRLDLSNVWEDELDFRVLDNLFQMGGPNTLTYLSPNIKWYECYKISWNSLRCKYQLKQTTTTRETSFWEKWA